MKPKTQPLAEFFSRARDLLTHQFRVAIPGTIGFGRSTVRFDLEIKDSQIEQTPEARLWRGTLTAWPRLFYV
jgi:hypothetical protein